MSDWSYTLDINAGGRFLVVITKLTQGGRRVDVSRVRGAPTIVSSYSSGDPFGDSTAVFTFPALTAFDDLDAADLSQWLGFYSDVDLYWAPTIDAGSGRYLPSEQIVDAATSTTGFVAPYRLRNADGVPGAQHAVKIWEGFIASLSPQAEGLQVQCQGALFQVDRYLAKPFYPARPWPLEELIATQFDRTARPQLRTAPLVTLWPPGWSRVVPPYAKDSANVYAPVARPGTKWTAYTSRQTGAWEHALTGFIQDQLSVMITRPGDGIAAGNQWTITQHLAGPHSAGRRPILTVRNRFAHFDFSMWVGTPGLEASLSGDSTQSENVIFGAGTDIHGTSWRGAVISGDGSRTDYLPLAASRDVYPAVHNPGLVRGAFVSEAMTKFGTGFSQTDATDVARQALARDAGPGWTGTVTISTDPTLELSRWQVRAGMVLRLQGFMGSGEAGVSLHISAVSANPEAGTVELTVDTRFRDLLTVQEAAERTRDPLTPVKMLQVNRASVMIPDIQTPWDYTAGSGYVPRDSKPFHDHAPADQIFPSAAWAAAHPPARYPQYYIKCTAAATRRDSRWAGPIPVLTSERGSINHSEFACYDSDGQLLKIGYHVSLYYLPVGASAMPRDKSGPSAFLDNAFEAINPVTGQPWNNHDGSYLQAEASFIIGWGNRQHGVYNLAGYSPGSQADGNQPTGMLTDDSTWTYDNVSNRDYSPYPKPGQRQNHKGISLWAMFYTEHTESVYFMGRLYRANPGADG